MSAIFVWSCTFGWMSTANGLVGFAVFCRGAQLRDSILGWFCSPPYPPLHPPSLTRYSRTFSPLYHIFCTQNVPGHAPVSGLPFWRSSLPVRYSVSCLTRRRQLQGNGFVISVSTYNIWIQRVAFHETYWSHNNGELIFHIVSSANITVVMYLQQYRYYRSR
jgi:hypothetical protein